MKVLRLPQKLLNPINLPGMGRSLEINGLEADSRNRIQEAFSKRELFIDWEEKPGTRDQVVNLWPDPHDPSRITLFIK